MLWRSQPVDKVLILVKILIACLSDWCLHYVMNDKILTWRRTFLYLSATKNFARCILESAIHYRFQKMNPTKSLEFDIFFARYGLETNSRILAWQDIGPVKHIERSPFEVLWHECPGIHAAPASHRKNERRICTSVVQSTFGGRTSDNREGSKLVPKSLRNRKTCLMPRDSEKLSTYLTEQQQSKRTPCSSLSWQRSRTSKSSGLSLM